MITIQILQDIKHEGHQYHVGELRKVDAKLAGYFCGNGWAKEPDAEALSPDTSPKTLEVQSITKGQKAATIGVK